MGLVIVSAIDHKSVVLFGLILLVTTFFLANGAAAAVDSRRSEIGVLRCLGWSRAAVFWMILGELLVVGLVSGLAGGFLSAGLIVSLGLRIPLWRVALIPPVAVLLAGVAGAVPAVRAARCMPLDAVNPVVRGGRRGPGVKHVTSLGVLSLFERPGRAVPAGIALAIGIASLTVILGLNFAFDQSVSGTALGGLVTTQIRVVDYLSVGLAIALGAASVADAVFLNLRERASELAVLSATGWQRRHIGRLILAEGACLGFVSSMVGAAVGLAVTAEIGAGYRSVLGGALASVLAGVGLSSGVARFAARYLAGHRISALVADD